MKIRLTSVSCLLVGLVLLTPLVNAQINTPSGATVPFGSNPEYEFGLMPTNLPTGGTFGKSQDAADAYNSWKSSFIEECGGSPKAYRVRFDNPSETVSEGIGYGMLLAAYAADKDLFDGLWQYYKNHRNTNGVMHWKISGCNSVIGQNGASDADVDAAMALLVAKCQWPAATFGTNPHNYEQDATNLINAIKDHEIKDNNTLTNGDMWNPPCRNPSYQAPGYYKEYKEHMGNQDTFWDAVVTSTYNLLESNAHSTTGLASNWSNLQGQPDGGCSGSGTSYDGFGYDAVRAPWRQAVDVLWHGAGALQTILSRQADFWISKGGAQNIRGEVSRDGNLGADHVSAFISMVAVGAMGSSNTTAHQQFVNDSYSENVNIASNGYFNRILRTIGLFVQTGNFWKPCGAVQQTNVTVTIESPSGGTVVSEGDDIAIEVNASTTNGSIAKVEFFYGNTLIGEDYSSPYAIDWNNIPAGSHTIKAVATSTGNETGQAAVDLEAFKGIFQTSVSPVIDGSAEPLWDNYNSGELNNVIQGDVAGSFDLSCSWKASWDNSNLYLFVEVTDDSKINDGPAIYQDDAVEIYIDINNDKSGTYGSDDVQLTFPYNDAVSASNSNTTGIDYAFSDHNSGYNLEISIPWSTLNESNPYIDKLMGFDVHVNDDDDGGDRDGKMSWVAGVDDAWQNTSLFGTVILKGGPVLTSVFGKSDQTFSAFPNPFKESFRIELKHLGPLTVRVSDLNGNEVSKFSLQDESSMELGNDLEPGVYLLQIIDGNNIESKKIIKLD